MRILTVPAALLLGVACTDIDSEDLLTSGMSAAITMTARGDGNTDADAILRAGGATSTTFVALTADDSLTVAAGDAAAVPLEEYEIAALHGYHATITGDDPATVYTIALTRTVDDGAPNTTVQLPPAFEITAPAANFSRAAAFTLDWTPAAEEPMELTVSGDCVNLYVNTIDADTGTFTIPAGTLTQVDAGAQNCDVTFTLKRTKVGSLDVAFEEGGSAIGIQERSASSLSAP